MRRLSSVLAVIAFTCVAILPLMARPPRPNRWPPPGPHQRGVLSAQRLAHRDRPGRGVVRIPRRVLPWVRAHPGGHLGLADVVGPFAGVQEFTFECTFVHQVFDATYATPVHSRAGSAVLHIEGCVDSAIATYDGTFSITTSSGSLSGTIWHRSTRPTPPAFFPSPHVTASTGSFSGRPGQLAVDIQLGRVPHTAVTGTVSQSPPV